MAGIWQGQAWRDQIKGNLGEAAVRLGASLGLDDGWSAGHSLVLEHPVGTFVQLDHVLIHASGVYLVETKAWRGSYWGDGDSWKRRDQRRQIWTPCDSPTQQSLYHAQKVRAWLTQTISELKQCQGVWLYPSVVFTQAKWLRANRCSVPIYDGIPSLMTFLQQTRPQVLSACLCQSIVAAFRDPSSAGIKDVTQ